MTLFAVLTFFAISMQALFVDALLLLFCATLFDAILVDRILRVEYDSYRWHWEKEGRPSGGFWFPLKTGKAVRTLGFNRAYRRYYEGGIAWNLFFFTPVWMEFEPEARRMLRLHRVMLTVAGLSLLTLLGVGIRLWLL